MEALSFDDCADFIRQWAKLSRKKEITPETQFEDDLGISGDDGCDLLEATEKRFMITLSSAEHGYRKTFDLSPNEFLFHPEGFGPSVPDMLRRSFGRPEPVVVAFTVGELYKAVQEALIKKIGNST
jgi:acyl carrier protein